MPKACSTTKNELLFRCFSWVLLEDAELGWGPGFMLKPLVPSCVKISAGIFHEWKDFIYFYLFWSILFQESTYRGSSNEFSDVSRLLEQCSEALKMPIPVEVNKMVIYLSSMFILKMKIQVLILMIISFFIFT